MIKDFLLNSDQMYWALAIGGSVLFALRVLVMVLGLSNDDHQSASDGDQDGHFQLFTIHSLTGFSMMFGWVGLGCLKQTELGPIWSCLAALGAGIIMLFITRSMFRMAGKLTSKGSDFHIEETVGLDAMVYQRIPATGSGKVHVTVNDTLRELLAVSEKNEVIDSFQTVHIKRIINDQTVEVI